MENSEDESYSTIDSRREIAVSRYRLTETDRTLFPYTIQIDILHYIGLYKPIDIGQSWSLYNKYTTPSNYYIWTNLCFVSMDDMHAGENITMIVTNLIGYTQLDDIFY